MSKKDSQAWAVFQKAMSSFEKKTGRRLFVAGEMKDTLLGGYRSFQVGPKDVGRRALLQESTSSDLVGDSTHLKVADVRNQEWWHIEDSRRLVSWLVKNSEDPPITQCWKDHSKKPSWWPADIKYSNPTNSGQTTRELHRIICTVYRQEGKMEQLGPKGEEIAAVVLSSELAEEAGIIIQSLLQAGVDFQFQEESI